MKNEFISKIRTSIIEGNFNEFASLVNSQLSDDQVASVFNLLCESKELFRDHKLELRNYSLHLASFFPKYYFEHLNRLYCNNLASIVDLIQPELYLKHQEQYANEIIKHIKEAYYYCSSNEDLLDKIDVIEFSNDKIQMVIDDLFILQNIQVNSEIYLKKLKSELTPLSWDVTLYSLCVFIEDFGVNQSVKNIVELFINEKPAGKFYGSNEDYFSFLSCIELDKTNEKVCFAGKQINANAIKNTYSKLREIFIQLLNYNQIEVIIESYCIQNNLIIKGQEEGSFEFYIKSSIYEKLHQKDGIKYQIESDYFHLVNQELNKSELLKDDLGDYNLQLWLSIEKTLIWLLDHGMIKTKEQNQMVKLNGTEIPLNILISFIAVQCIHSKRLFGDVIQNMKGKDTIEKLLNVLFEGFKTGVDKGFPFHLRDVDEFKKGFIKTFGTTNDDESDLIDKCDRVINQFIFDKEKNPEILFSFNKHTHIKLGTKVFGFRKLLSATEPSHYIFNTLLNVNSDKKNNQDTSFFETNLVDAFINNGFNVLSNEQRKKISKDYNIEFDVLAYKSGVFFSFELKSTNFRQNLNEINLHINRDLMKAAYQLDKNLDFIEKHPEVIADLFGCSSESIKAALKKTYIVSTTFEGDHTYVGGHLKISYFELMRILYNEKDKVLLSYLSSAIYYPGIYESTLINSLAESNLESEINEKSLSIVSSFIRKDELTANELIRLLENNIFWDFMDGIHYPIQKLQINKGKLTTEFINELKIRLKNIDVVNYLLGLNS